MKNLKLYALAHVINYGLPDDIESYTHRSGRTGRAGKKGTSISIIHTREKRKVRDIEREIGKDFVDGTLPTPKEICTKQLYKAIDEIEKADVDEEEIAPFMDDINRHFEFVDKEDILKKIVSLEFGRFLKYYADAPEILKPTNERNKRDAEGRGKTGRTDRSRGPRKAEAGFKRLFINLGKADGFYPGEVMQFVNRHVDGRQEIGHIDLLSKFSYIEVPEQDAQKVIRALDGTSYKGRSVRCNDADSRDGGASGRGSRGGRSSRDGGNRGSRDDSRSSGRSERTSRRGRDNDGYGKNDGFAKYEKKSKRRNYDDDLTFQESGKKDDWKQFFQHNDNVKLKGTEPDFTEEGWARRKPRKK